MGTLPIAGMTPLTTIDYPGALSAVLFCQGCPWRCPYCHNPHLLAERGDTSLPWTEVMMFLRRRRGLLDAVVFSGGEPTLHEGLAEAIRQVRAMGYRVGLHTAGPLPGHLAQVLPLLDWVGMDMKAPFDGYDAVTRTPGSGAKALESLRLLLQSGVAHEIRTTVGHPSLTEEALRRMAEELAALGVRHYVLQSCRRDGTSVEAKENFQFETLAEGVRGRHGARFESFSCR